MFDLQKIAAIYQRAADEKWTYPYLFNSLKSIGIERYEVNVLTHEIKYVGEGTTLVSPPPEGAPTLTAPEKLDVAALKTALTRVQAGETTYPQFLGEIAAAGVPFYRVDMRPRTVTYHGARRDQKLVEAVPETTA